MKYTLEDFSAMIDHVNVKPNVLHDDLKKLCDEAVEHNFKIVAINSVHTKYCYSLIEGSSVGVGAAVSFPYGQTTIEMKVSETIAAINEGATEIDYTLNVTEAREHNFDYIRREMEEIVSVCSSKNVVSKVILETCFLTDFEIEQICLIAKDVKPTYVKTSTGTAVEGATVKNVELMKAVVGKDVLVKASGGVRDLDTFIAMVKAGASRIGTSTGIQIIKEIKEMIDASGVDYLEL